MFPLFPNSMMTSEITPRVITLGDSGVGKTTLIHRMKTNEFVQDTTPTIGAGVTSVDVEVRGRKYPLQIWDTAGQEMYRNIIPIYFKGAVFAILVFAMNDLKSFRSLDSWREEIAEHSDPDIGIVLVGTKYDMDDKQVDDDMAKKYADDHQLTLFFASSLTGQNIQVILEYVAVSHSDRKKMDDTGRTVTLADKKKGGKCC